MPKADSAKIAENTLKPKKVKLNWPTTNEPVYAANAFYFTFQDEYAVMFVGQIDPLDTYVKEGDEPPDELSVMPYARYQLTPTAFMRLKSQVDEVYDGLKTRGVIND